jgi:hypothetical protein
MGFSTRAMMAGLLGFGLLTAMPGTAEARGDARQMVQTQRGTAPAARPIASRPQAARPQSARPQAQATRRDAAPTRNAAARPASQPSSRQQASLPSRRAAADARNMNARQRASAVPYANSRQAAANPRSLRQTAALTCTTRGGRRVCAPDLRNTAFRWTGGLAPAAMSQSACPDGTIATTAIGHSNVVRCVPL